MQIYKLFNRTFLAAVVLIGLNAVAQLPFPPPPSGSQSSPALPTRDIQTEVAQMNQRYGLSDDQATKVRTILDEQTKKSEEVFKDQSLPIDQRFSRLQSLKQEEISRVSAVLTPEQRKKYEADGRPSLPAQLPAPGAASGQAAN